MAQQQIRMNYFCCQKGGDHEGESLNFICIQQSCPNKTLLCAVCKLDSHPQHRIVPLKMFLGELLKSSQKESQPHVCTKIFESLDLIRDAVLEDLRVMVESVTEFVKKYEQNVIQTHSFCKKQVTDKIVLSNTAETIINNLLAGHFETIADVNKDLTVLLENVKFTVNGYQLKQDYNNIIASFENRKKELETKLKAVKTDIDSVTSLTEKLGFSLSEAEEPPNMDKFLSSVVQATTSFTFSPTMKGKEIVLADNEKSVRQGTNSPSRFAFMQQPLKKGVNKISMQVKNLANWVGVGIAVLKPIKDKNFTFNYNDLGHGSYLVSTNGFTWSHSEKAENIVNRNFSYKLNDIIEIEVILPGNKLTFKNRSNGNTLDMKISLSEAELNDVYFCCNLCNAGDAVIIVD